MVREGEIILVLADVLGGCERADADESQKAFSNVSKGNEYIIFSKVHSAIRRVRLKVNDSLDTRFGMREDGIQDAGLESHVENERTLISLPNALLWPTYTIHQSKSVATMTLSTKLRILS